MRRRPMPSAPLRLGALALAIALLFHPSTGRAAPKTDVIRLVNGDAVTGEVQSLEHGLLTYKTDSMGTLNVEWGEVRGLTSASHFEITLESGELLYGSFLAGVGLDTLGLGVLEIVRRIPLREVVAIVSLEKRFWSRFDGSLQVGFSYTKSTRVSELSLASSTQYKTQTHRLYLSLSALQSQADQAELKIRNSVSLGMARVLSGRWYAGIQGQAERNDELGVARRISGGVGSGYYFIQSQSMELSTLGGVLLNGEKATGSDSLVRNTEALVTARYSLFRYNSPKTSVSLSTAGYANLNFGNRYRLEVDVTASYEVFKDFFAEISFYEQVDSNPPNISAGANDYGLITSIGWSY